jgi:hypothetical protein
MGTAETAREMVDQHGDGIETILVVDQMKVVEDHDDRVRPVRQRRPQPRNDVPHD